MLKVLERILGRKKPWATLGTAGEKIDKGDLVGLATDGKVYKVGGVQDVTKWPKSEKQPGSDLIAYQRGHNVKRNKVHLYRQPYGYPIRACDWNLLDLESLEVIASSQPAPGLENETVEYALEGLIGRRSVCRHCLAVIAGKRASIGKDSLRGEA